ncbi:class I SAM-dependent methyltransferase [Paraburkholderia atlantica]|uniref:class I SAM-dependent methyltransferase n=1 Tax=Paraburkholderia atlantica TaxID=2654982 RepID=UPI001614417A
MSLYLRSMKENWRFEHVGRQNLAGYFAHVEGLLAEDGVLMNHGITSRSSRARRASVLASFRGHAAISARRTDSFPRCRGSCQLARREGRYAEPRRRSHRPQERRMLRSYGFNHWSAQSCPID